MSVVGCAVSLGGLEARVDRLLVSPALSGRLARWVRAEPCLGSFGSLSSLVDAIQGERDVEVSSAWSGALLRLAATDELAGLVLLRVLSPFMGARVGLVGRWAVSSGVGVPSVEDRVAMVSSAVWLAIGRCAGRSPTRPLSVLTARAHRELVSLWRVERPSEATDPEVLAETTGEVEQGLVRVRAALMLQSLGRVAGVSARDLEVVWLSRVEGWTVEELAERAGVPADRLRRARHRAERRLATGGELVA